MKDKRNIHALSALYDMYSTVGGFEMWLCHDIYNTCIYIIHSCVKYETLLFIYLKNNFMLDISSSHMTTQSVLGTTG